MGSEINEMQQYISDYPGIHTPSYNNLYQTGAISSITSGEGILNKSVVKGNHLASVSTNFATTNNQSLFTKSSGGRKNANKLA